MMIPPMVRLPFNVDEECETDCSPVGLSRVQSRDRVPASRPMSAHDHGANGSVLGRTGTAADHQPFSETDLALAMKRSHLEVPHGKA